MSTTDTPKKLHKFIKKTLHKISTSKPNEDHNNDNIFERSAGLLRTLLSNPETPLHCSTEDYISPILDSTTEMIRNPNVDLSSVRLNCLEETSPDGISDEEDNYFNQQEGCACGGSEFSPRSRLRSIISTSLMTCLEGEDCKRKGNVSPLARRLSRRNTEKSWEAPNEGDATAIEYYSFADMVNSEDFDPALATSHRKGSCYTISVKDYIGVL